MKDPQDPQDSGLDGIAIVGMAARYPQARDVAELWRNLREGIDCVSRFAEDELETGPAPEDPRYVRARGVLEDPDLFDAGFFDIPPRQAELMDPQNRLFLESAWQALEDAGVDPQRFPGAIGVFGGVTLSTYFLNNLLSNPELLAAVGSYQVALATDRDYLTTFVSYKLGLRGPSLDVQTACSTSLVATVLACQSLLGYQCDLALAGGVSVKVPQKTGYLWHPGGLDSSDGYCRAFDAQADGSVYGSGVGVVALKRLEDALADGDEIYAVIRGAALNNDGSARVGFTAPGVEGQAEVITTAQALAGVDPESIGYVECHGSGTALGDPIEVAALTKAFRANGSRGRGFCAIGSIKTNVGHCSAAAGVAGLIKASLALRHREIPPSLHFQAPNPAIDFASSPFYVADRLIPWAPNGEPRRAGVSSFGLGGTNAHVILEEAPEAEPSGPSRPWQLLLLSARSEAALEEGTDRLAADLAAHPDRPLADVAFTTQAGRRAFAVRRALVCRDTEDARQALTGRDPRRLLDAVREPGKRPVAFLFPGVGDHYVGMARGLYETEPTFREHFDRCAELLRPRLGVDLREVVFAEEGPGEAGSLNLRRLLGRAPQEDSEAARRLHRTLYAQPAVFAVDYALARLWMSWGVRPAALLGYSLGEYVAACLAGVLSLEDALLLVAERARLLDGLPPGAMLAVPLDEVRVRELIAGTDLDLAAVNGPGLCVVAGPEESVAALRERLAVEDVPVRLLPGTHAFHSRQMEPVVEALTRIARGLRFAPPKIPFVSNVTGTWITPAEATDPAHWARHLVGTVWFASGVTTLWEDPARVLLEVGPGFGLSTLALQAAPADGNGERLALPSLRNQHERQPDEAFLLGALARLWLAGVEIDWAGFSQHEQRRRARLPGYPFERQRYWVEHRRGAAAPSIPRRREVVADGLTGDAFEQARAAAPGTRLVLVEDEATVRLISRLRELEALGAEVVVASAAEAEDEATPEEPARLAARHARPRLRNAWIEPAGEAEQWVAGIFEELLGIGGVGAHDSFFELGGHSLLATRLAARLRDRFGVELPVGDLFAAPTPAGLAERLQDARPAEIALEPPLAPVERDGEIPLSHAQQRLWFLDRLMPGNPFYNLAGGARLGGELDAGALRAALAEMARRHETLRTSFADVDGRPVQRIALEISIPLPLVDLTELPENETAIREAAAAHARVPFDLGRAPLLRCALLRLRSDEHVLVWAMHHIVSDAWSMTVLLREMAVLYAAFTRGEPSPLPPLPVQYADFAVWQRRRLDGGLLERQLAWWRQRLAGAPVTELPTDRPRPALQTFRGATWRTSAPASLSAAVEALARQGDASPFMVLLAAFQALLLRYTGQEDVTIGSPIANRTRSELEGILGFFVNTLVLRTDLGGDPPFERLLERVREAALGAYAHQDLPFEQLVEALQPRRDLSRNPLFQILFNLLNVPSAHREAGGALTFAPLTPPGGTALVDLQAYVTLSEAGISIAWEHNTDLFEESTVRRLASHFETLLAGATADPGQRLSALPLLSAAERGQLLTPLEPVEPVAAPSATDQFETWVDRAPEAVALVSGRESLTYRELEARANQLARHLRRLGVGPEVLVGVCLERSPDLIATLLAVGKAGGAYVPLDPAHPAERRAWTLADSGTRMVVTRSAEGVPDGVRIVDPAEPERAGESAERLEPVAGPDHRAYLIYTSGSTGRPKGVEVSRGAFAAFLAAMARRPGLAAGDALLAVTTVSFDIAGLEIFLPLATGARIELADREEAQDGRRLAARITDAGITALQATPATWRLLLATGWEGSPRLRALCGGETLPRDLAAVLAPRVAELWNVYGPTETTVWSSSYRVDGDNTGSVPVGQPIDGTALYVLGRAGELVPPGGLGELAIGGAGVARGYLGRPDLTAERFVPDPFSPVPGARLYRTGDLARRLADGNLELLGRIDHQLKLRGYRIEPGEIEAALTEDPAVRQAVVALRADGANEPRLVAWVVWNHEVEPDLERLRESLRRRLPAYMLPAAYVELEALPLTPSGKVDRNALPAPEASRTAGAVEPPRTATEAALAEIWREVLGGGEIGVRDDFFERGGHSLLATQVVARLRDAFGLELPLSVLFQETTLERLAARVDRERQQAVPALARPQPTAGPLAGAFPLSFAQRGLWVVDRLAPGNPAYVIPAALRLTGRLDVHALHAALQEIVKRHAALQVTFGLREGEPVQVLPPELPVMALPEVDLTGVTARDAELRRLVAEDARRPFDLETGPLLRATLVRLDDGEHAVLFALHHIVSDAWSLGVLVREVGTLYAAFAQGRPSPLPPLSLQYPDYVEWQREHLGGGMLERQIAWWRERLAGAPALDLPADHRRPPVPRFRGDVVSAHLPEAAAARFRDLCRSRGATLFMGLLAVFEALLARWSGQDDLVVGTTIANRRHSDLEGLIGLFVNTLALRADLAGDPPFRELLERVRTSTLQAYEHQDVPFERLIAELGLRREAGRTPLVQVLFQAQNAPTGELDLPGLTLAPLSLPSDTAPFDLVVSVTESPGGAVLTCRYDRDLFERPTVARLLGHFAVLVEGAGTDPDLRLSDLPLLTDEEQHQLLHVWNPEPAEESERFVLHERLAERAAEQPQAVAITDGQEGLTYGALEARSNRIANLLVDEGVRPGDVVALALERSADLVAAIVGVLKTGAAYLPLDPAYPPERLAFSLQDAEARALVTHSGLLDRLPEQAAPTLLLDRDQERLERAAATPPDVAVTPDFPAYVIYTSGSTGRPKGVVVTHGQVARLFTSTDGWFGFSSEDVWTLFHSYAFDFSVWEIWGALLTGGRLVIVPALTSRAPDAFVELMRAERVTVLNQTPSAFRQVMRAEPHPPTPSPIAPPSPGRGGATTQTARIARGWGFPPLPGDGGAMGEGGQGGEVPLRLVLFGGEALDPTTLTPWFARHGEDNPRLVNMYGITETTVHVTYRPLSREDAGRGSVIGFPIPDLTVHLLDRAGRLVPVGVPGEICVGGAGVTLGYLGRPELTAERFVPDPFGRPGARLYRSGDLARRTADGDLEYLGRIDHQVKIRGFRIELGEIEAALAAHPAIREAVAVARQDGGDEPRLVAYVVPREGEMPAAAELRSFLKGSLPEHMLPAVYVPLERLPLTANGKVDRRSLPEPEPGQAALATGDEPPRTDLEARLAEMWREALRVDRIGIHDDFFALGGSSITAALVVNRMQEELGGSIPVVAIFEAPTVAGFAAWLERELPQAAAVGAVPPLRPYPWAPGEPVPLSFAQERLWFLDQLDGASPTYNIPAALRLTGRLDAAVLDRVLTEIVRRHAALRTRFSSVNGRPVQVIEPPAPFPVPRVDLSGLAPERAELEARRLAVLEAACSFDLTRGSLLRAVLLRLGGEDHAVLFNLHHIVGDGWSMGVLTRELAVLHEAFSAGRPSPLPELPVQYADYARWQRAWLRGEVLAEHLAWWRERLAGAPVLQLPTDRPRPPVQTFRGAARGFVLPPRLADELAVLGRGRGATLFMTLLAAFAALLQRHTGQDDVSVGSPVAGRPRAALEDLIGFFVNTLVLRVDGSGAPAFGDLLARTRETVIAAFAHQEVPFEKVVEEVQPERDLSRTPLFQVLFVLQNAGGEDLRLPGLTLTGLRTDAEVPAKVDLTLAIAETAGGLAGRLDYNLDLFDGPTIARLAEHWMTLLEAVAAAPEAPLADLPLLSAAERHQLLAEWGSGAAISRPATTEGLIAAQAARTPDAPALISPEGSVTYRELVDRAGRLASFLRSSGVGPDVRVAVLLDRSPELIIAFLAVLQAGGAYVPIDPTYPAERIDLLLEESAAPIVLTRESLSGLPPGSPADFRNGRGHGGYVIYTSGSTGRPKGVLAGTAGLAAFASAMVETLGLGPGDRSLLFVTPAFDASAVTIYPTLVSGGALVLHPDPPSLSPAEILAFAWEQELTLLDIPGSLWRQMVQEMASGAMPVPPVRAWLTGGEPLSVEALRQWAGVVREDAVFLSSYGPTEATVTTSALVLSAREARSFRFDGAPIGRPLGAAEVLLLDAAGRPAPIGVPGELLVGGPGVTRGYLGRPDLTAGAFRPHPLAGRGGREPGARVYRTGDLARWRADGSLEFLGRGDQQIKIRGFRIEPGEIEEALMRHPGVGQAVAGIRETERGDRRLVAWVVTTPGASAGAAELRDFLRERLPEHMVPSGVAILDRFPLTASSKVDRRALPDPERAAEEGDFLAPVGEIEETLAAVWARLLGVERVSRQADFFALGGHSLLATQLVSRLREVFGVELPLRRVFEASTLGALGQAVEQARRERTATATPPLQPRPQEDGEPLPLSFAQERLWFIDQLQPGLATYNLPEAVRLTGPLDAAALERAFAEVVARHEPLRTRFPVVGGVPVQEVQEVDPPGAFSLPVVDLAALPEEVREGERDRLVRAEAGRPFDLARGPLLRAGLVRLGVREHVLALTLHHIVTDGWSMGVLIRELGTAYSAFACGARPVLPALPVRYADWAAWQRDWLRGEALDAQLAFWRERLGGEVPPLDLPLDHPRPPGDVIRGARQVVRVPAGVVTALEALGRGEEATLFMLLLAGFASLLHRLTGQDDLTVGTPVAGRTRAEVEGLVGLFLNTLALRTELAGDPPFRELVHRARTVSLDAYSHQDLPFEKLVEEIQPERVVGRTPFFQAMLVLQNAPAGELAAGELTLAPVPSYNQTVRFDLTMSLTQSASGLTGWIEFKPDLLDATTVTRWVDGLVRLLAGAATDPDRRLSELPLLSDAELHQAAAEWNDTAAEEPLRPVCLHELFAEQAARTPDAIAVDGSGEELTYRELERRAAGLARRILGRGVRPGERVAILMRPSPSRVAAVLAVLAAGAAYVPLDPASPRERLEQMLRDSDARLLLADEPLEIAEMPVLIPGGSEAEGLAGLPSASPGDLAYIVYTSGSTGTPKGVVIEHRQAVNTILDINRRFGLGPEDRVFAISALSFDLSVWDLFGTLAAGGTVVLPASEERPDPAAWSARMAAAGVTVWNSAPPLLDMLVESGASLPPTLRLALLSGDWIPVTLPGRVRRQVPACRVVSLGGATEGSIWSILFPINAVDSVWRSIPYGRPMENQRFHIVDRHDNPVPVGVAGELRIGGAGVAVGYFGRPELTAERFVPDPFDAPGDQPGGRLYRTGDLGRFRADGTIEFLGRLDTQVKIRGFRVELGEIETVLSRHPGVREAVVLARQDGAAPAAGGDRRLVAYVVAASEGAPAAAELRAWLAARLPDFMVPPHFLFLEALPVTPNGKLDRRALPAPEAEPRERVAPRDAVEQHLAEIWERLLGIPDVGVHDNFFELGGHSLLATRLIAAVREEMGVELPLREVFERPTVAGLALAVAERRVEGVAEDELARLLDGVQGLSDEEIELLLAGDEE
jgi:amino acid adenylation domain-containing protein